KTRSGGREFLQNVLGNLEIGKYVLHIVVVLERGDELHDALGTLLVHLGCEAWLPNGLDALRFAELFLERGGHGSEAVESAADVMARVVGHGVVGAGLYGGLEHGVGGAGGVLEADLAHMLEHVRHSAGRGKIAAVFRKGCSHGAAGAVA